VFATVYEFDSDGSVDVFEAQDYLAPVRHQKFKGRSLKLSSEISSVNKFNEYVMQASRKYNVDANLIHAVIKAESSYNPDAISPKGAGGLMQLMPDTATQYGVTDRFSPEENIDGGTKYLKFLLDRYEGDISLAIAAYNAGEGTVDKYNGIPPYLETIRAVRAVDISINPPFFNSRDHKNCRTIVSMGFSILIFNSNGSVESGLYRRFGILNVRRLNVQRWAKTIDWHQHHIGGLSCLLCVLNCVLFPLQISG